MDPGIASLPWYDLPEIRGATDRLWRRIACALRARGIPGVPDELSRDTDYEAPWHSPRYLLGQCCGYDLVLPHATRLQPVATPVYSGSRAGPGRYRSLVVVAERCDAREVADLRGRRCVVNGPTSHSGMNVLRALVAPLSVGGRFFSSVAVSGSHESSVTALRRGEADVAAVDSVVYALLERYRPAALEGLRVLCETPCAPSPPFVTSAATPPERVQDIRSALHEAVTDPRLAATRSALLLDGLVAFDADAYRSIVESAEDARTHGYCLLRERAAAA